MPRGGTIGLLDLYIKPDFHQGFNGAVDGFLRTADLLTQFPCRFIHHAIRPFGARQPVQQLLERHPGAAFATEQLAIQLVDGLNFRVLSIPQQVVEVGGCNLAFVGHHVIL